MSSAVSSSTANSSSSPSLAHHLDGHRLGPRHQCHRILAHLCVRCGANERADGRADLAQCAGVGIRYVLERALHVCRRRCPRSRLPRRSGATMRRSRTRPSPRPARTRAPSPDSTPSRCKISPRPRRSLGAGGERRYHHRDRYSEHHCGRRLHVDQHRLDRQHACGHRLGHQRGPEQSRCDRECHQHHRGRPPGAERHGHRRRQHDHRDPIRAATAGSRRWSILRRARPASRRLRPPRTRTIRSTVMQRPARTMS